MTECNCMPSNIFLVFHRKLQFLGAQVLIAKQLSPWDTFCMNWRLKASVRVAGQGSKKRSRLHTSRLQ